MINTKYSKVEFGHTVHSQYKREAVQNTQCARQEEIEVIKMIQKGTDNCTFSGYRKVNYAEQKVKEAYQKINKMLGGN